MLRRRASFESFMSFGMAGYSNAKDAGLELRGHGYWLTTIYWVLLLLKQPDKHNPTSLVVLKSRTMRAFGNTSGGGVELATRVSCGKYFKADIGTLSLSAGRLSFETKGRRLFDVSLESIEKITWHWYSFSGAFEARIAGVNYFLSFVPRNSGLSSWHDGLTIGRQWRAALEGRPMPQGPPLGARIFVLVINLVLVFFLICFLILTLGAAVDPHQTTGERILSGVCAAFVFLMLVMGLAGSASPPAPLTAWKQVAYDELPRGASAVSIATYAAAKRRYGMHTDNAA